MTIVELIDAHSGFRIITERIHQTNKRKLLWVVTILAFFLSAVLDNLTTTIVAISLLRKLIADDEDRRLYAGAVIIAANAGGAWSPTCPPSADASAGPYANIRRDHERPEPPRSGPHL